MLQTVLLMRTTPPHLARLFSCVTCSRCSLMGKVSIDTAWDYHDEHEIAKGIAATTRTRESIFLQTKV